MKHTPEEISSFLAGHNPMERVVKIECSYSDEYATLFYRNEQGQKHATTMPFYPFVWVRREALDSMCYGNKEKLANVMSEYGLRTKTLTTHNEDHPLTERMRDGYTSIIYSTIKMSYSKFMGFFKKVGFPIYPKEKEGGYGKKYYISLNPVEQFMVQTGIRLFKGYEDYDDVLRMEWDLETEGLDPNVHMISQIGLRTNKGFEKIITIDGNTREEKKQNEINGITEFFQIIKDIDPDVITGHNTENFDWVFVDTRLQKHGSNLQDFSLNFFPKGVYKKGKQTVLKLGGEMEYYYPTVFWGKNITDSLHAVRRAQALDSTMKKADLKYVTKFSKLNKPNRVYVPGKIINTVWEDLTKSYALNDENGDWYKITEKKPLTEEYEAVTGRYIVQRYLLDDLYEGDKVELRYNQSNFLVGKMLSLPFERVCTMGTAGIWKSIMLAWSYEHDLAIPLPEPSRTFTGGLSRLIKCGLVEHVAKFDYNSLYPSIILSFDMHIGVDITDVMPSMLEYILTQREYYKGLKKKYGIEADKYKEEKEDFIRNLRIDEKFVGLTDNEFGAKISQMAASGKIKEINEYNKKIQGAKSLSSKNDKMQLPLKILGNSWFGSASTGVFNWDDINIGERITCTGRQMFRLLIVKFQELGYQPIVGDTDGINFRIPDKLRYTDEHPYISNGAGRNSVKGKAYTGISADVREFEDLYLWGKNGLDIDEVIPASINFKRKTYADLLEDGEVKLVGNSIKSKKMPLYIEKFLDVAIRLLLENKGGEFLEFYYDYIEKIYNYKIPLKEIASVGKIKTSLSEYKKKCQERTKSGTKKARQAWYELAIRDGMKVNMGDTVYYINTGSKKGDADIKRETHYYSYDENGKRVDVTKALKKEYDKLKKLEKEGISDAYNKLSIANNGVRTQMSFADYVSHYYPSYQEEDELIFNCVAVPNEIVEDEDEHFCDDNFEYNVEKYIEMLNKRITSLLVCFHSDVRNTTNEKGKVVSNILINNPKDRKYFTESECQLVSGYPENPSDQDRIEDVLRMEDKEIKFWTSVGKTPPYLKECGMDWDEIKRDYYERMMYEDKMGITDEKNLFMEVVSKLGDSEIEDFNSDGTIPPSFAKFVMFDEEKNEFISKKFNVPIGSIHDLIERVKLEKDCESENENEQEYDIMQNVFNNTASHSNDNNIVVEKEENTLASNLKKEEKIEIIIDDIFPFSFSETKDTFLKVNDNGEVTFV